MGVAYRHAEVGFRHTRLGMSGKRENILLEQRRTRRKKRTERKEKKREKEKTGKKEMKKKQTEKKICPFVRNSISR